MCSHQDWKVPLNRRDTLPSRIKVLSFDDEGCSTADPQELRDVNELITHLSRINPGVRPDSPTTTLPTRSEDSEASDATVSGTTATASTRHVYLLEGSDPRFVGALGAHFDIDPALFFRHKRTALWEGRHQAGNTRRLASAQDPSQSFIMEYCEILYFLEEPPRGLGLRNPNDNRHIDLSRKPEDLSSELDRVGNLHRKASFWSKAHQDGRGWDGEILNRRC